MINNVVYCIINWFIIAWSIGVYAQVFRDEKRWRYKAVQVLMWCVWIAVISAEAWDSQHGFIPWLQIIVNGILNSILLKIFYRCKFRVALAGVWFYNIAISMIKLPMVIGRGVWFQENAYWANVGNGRRIDEIILCGFILCAMYLITGVKCRGKIEEWLKILENSRAKNYIFLLVEFSMIELLSDLVSLGEQQYENKDFIVTVAVVFGMVTGSCLYLLYIMYRQSRMEQQILMIEQQLLMKENEVIRGYCEQDAKRLHDLKHTFLYLQECMEMKKYDQARQCVKEHLEEVKEKQRQVWTGIDEIDFILNYKYQQIQKQKIEFQLKLEVYKIPLVSGEKLMIVLGNLLDNAIEAAQKCSMENRKIYLTIKNVNEFFIIRVKNSCEKKPVKRKGKFITNKEDGIGHGWGIENVKKIVEEVNGEYESKYDKGWFITSIILCEGGRIDERGEHGEHFA